MLNAIFKKLTALTTLATMAAFCVPSQITAATPDDKFVRTAAPYMKLVDPSVYDDLAEFDLLILPAELQESQPAVFGELRRRNQDIIILAYVPTKSYITGWGDSLHVNLKSGISDQMWLRDSYGGAVSVWPGTKALNITTDWNSYLPNYVHDKIISTGKWDGIFWDEVSDSISWVNNGNVDLNRDGAADGAATADTAWKAGMKTLLQNARRLDPTKIFVINGVSTPEYQPLVNGRMFESFPTPWEANGDWYEIMRRYVANMPIVANPETFIVNANTGNTGASDDYRKMRFALASTLMGDGYFSFDFGDQDHGQIWRYDEYGVYLGRPTSTPKNVTTGTKLDATSSIRFSAGVWQRDYEKGIVIVNPTDKAQTVSFDSEYEKIRGTQDTATNDGSIISSVTIGPKDGLIMLRPLDEISGATYSNGSFVRIWDASGSQTRGGFFAYDDRFKGSTQVIEKDLDNDGRAETAVSDKTTVKVYGSDGAARASWQPFGAKWKNGMEIAVGDVNNDGTPEIVVGAGPGGTPEVKIYTPSGKLLDSFLAYSKRFTGGVHLAVGNVDADHATTEIVTGAGPGGGPHVRVFTGSGIIKYQFFAYATAFTGGVYVAVGDVAGLNHGQVVTGAGPGGGPHVRIIDPTDGNRVIAQFFAASKSSRKGIRVSAGDINGDGRAEIISQSNDVFAAALLDAPPVELNSTPPAEIPPSEETPESENITDKQENLFPEYPLFLGMDYEITP